MTRCMLRSTRQVKEPDCALYAKVALVILHAFIYLHMPAAGISDRSAVAMPPDLGRRALQHSMLLAMLLAPKD